MHGVVLLLRWGVRVMLRVYLGAVPGDGGGGQEQERKGARQAGGKQATHGWVGEWLGGGAVGRVGKRGR